MENPIPITYLNDFIFCPVSIYFHSLDIDTERMFYQTEYQINGTASHITCDDGSYTDKKSVLMGMAVYSEKYNLYGKIDIFDNEKKILTERKKKIINIYDGYIFQLYAQYFSMKEMGDEVNTIRFYSMDDNKAYNQKLPKDNPYMFSKFESVINKIKAFSINNFIQDNAQKCSKCIYEPLCSFSRKGESVD